jgi:uridine kinase
MTKPFIIGITGGSGSGKTTFIKRIREQFSEEEVCIISQDEYYKDRSLQKTDANGYQNFDLPKSIDKKAFTHDVGQLLAGSTVKKLEYVFNNKDASPSVKTFRPAPIIIVEGLFVFHYAKMRDLLDFKVFFYAADHLKVIRRIRRDQVERGYPIDDVLYRYEHHVMPSYKKYIEPYMQEADLIINNNRSFEYGFEAFSSFLRERLQKTKKEAETNT